MFTQMSNFKKPLTKKVTTLETWTDICQSLFPERNTNASVHPIHSCVIDGIRHYIHCPRLEERDPSYFEQLKSFAKQHSFQLKPDRRTPNDTSNHERRKKLLPIIFLALGVNAASVFADHTDVISQKTTLNMIPKSSLLNVDIAHKPTQDYLSTDETPYNKEESKRIQSILAYHFDGQPDDPASIAADLKSLADYYSRHPEAINLIDSIAQTNWALKYSPHTFQTDVKGSRLQVKEVVVYFDPRSGAKLKFYDKCSAKVPFCVASPADALLHELLHVHSVLKDTSSFIAEGGLNQHIYPAAHERKTILKENILYKSMSRRDKHPRPIRSEHTGRHVLVSCVTCVQ